MYYSKNDKLIIKISVYHIKGLINKMNECISYFKKLFEKKEIKSKKI